MEALLSLPKVPLFTYSEVVEYYFGISVFFPNILIYLEEQLHFEMLISEGLSSFCEDTTLVYVY